MDKIELFYFYKMYRIIMALLQSENSENSAAVLKILNDENLDMSKCYEIYHENLTKIEDIKYNEIARIDFEKEIYEQYYKEDRESNGY